MNSEQGIRGRRTVAPLGAASVRIGGVARLCWWVRGLLARARRRARLRRELARLDERLIHDMGARRLDLEAEAAKPWWRD